MKKYNPESGPFVAPESETCEHPGVILSEEFLKPLGITQANFARHLQVPAMVMSDLVNGKRGINTKLALLLSLALDTSPDFWLTLQKNYEYGNEVKKLRRTGELEKIRAIGKYETAPIG